MILLVIAAILLKLLGGKGGGESQVVTDVVQYGAITSTVEGSGLTKAKSSETITLTTAGTVMEVLVTEGQQVTAGTPLFTIDSPAAESAVQKARSDVEGYEKQLSQAQKDIAGLNLTAHLSRQADGDGDPEPRRSHQQGPEGGGTRPTTPACGWSSITAMPTPGICRWDRR